MLQENLRSLTNVITLVCFFQLTNLQASTFFAYTNITSIYTHWLFSIHWWRRWIAGGAFLNSSHVHEAFPTFLSIPVPSPLAVLHASVLVQGQETYKILWMLWHRPEESKQTASNVLLTQELHYSHHVFTINLKFMTSIQKRFYLCLPLYNIKTHLASHNHKMNLYSATYNTGQRRWTE